MLRVGIASYRKNDYPELLKLAVDRDDLDQTWEAWKVNMENLKKNLKEGGLEVVKVPIELEKLEKYCRENGLPNNSETRSAYVQKLVSRMK